MAYSSVPGGGAHAATYGWMHSTGHRNILLDADARSMAVGVACSGSGHYEAIARVWAVGSGVAATSGSPAVTSSGGGPTCSGGAAVAPPPPAPSAPPAAPAPRRPRTTRVAPPPPPPTTTSSSTTTTTRPPRKPPNDQLPSAGYPPEDAKVLVPKQAAGGPAGESKPVGAVALGGVGSVLVALGVRLRLRA
jgi:hypothetical protein